MIPVRTIYKAGGILIKDRKVLLTKSFGKDHYIAPGGRLEGKETPEEALCRELQEELSIRVTAADLEPFGEFAHPAVGELDAVTVMYVFMVKQWQGEIVPAHEIERLAWVDSRMPTEIKIGSIFAEEVIPKLKNQGLID
jgi:mutator protein MutT